MKTAKVSLRVKLGKPLYSSEALAAGALALGTRAQVYVDESKSSFSVDIVPAGNVSPAAALALEGEFLNEALNHEYRQRVVRANSPLTQALFAPLFAKGFPAVPADPLEELEPQVKADRAKDIEDLLAQAREMR